MKETDRKISMLLESVRKAKTSAAGPSLPGEVPPEKILESLLESRGVLLTVLDADQRFVFWNRGAEEITGYSRAEVVGSGRIFEALYPDGDYRSQVARGRDEVLGGAPRDDHEIDIRTKDGQRRTISLSSRRVVDGAGRPAGLVNLGIDVTARRLAEDGLRQRSEQLEALRQVGLDITAQLEPDRVLQSITERALALFGGDAGNLFLLRPERQKLERVVSVGPRETTIPYSLRQGQGLAGAVWEAGTPLLAGRETGAPFAGDDLPWGSALAAPIRSGGEFLGVLEVLAAEPGKFGAAQRDMVDLFATQAAVAIVNARLFAAVERLATLDELTGVLNRRGLGTLGPREVERARRFRHPLSAIFVDLDHFKALNDRYSHQVGDRILQEVTKRIRAGVRGIDLVARIGGEEFVVLLAETGLRAAREVAERLREETERISVETELGPVGVTVSVGVAALDRSVSDLDDLVHVADAAMYRAKQSGRNRVVVHGSPGPLGAP